MVLTFFQDRNVWNNVKKTFLNEIPDKRARHCIISLLPSRVISLIRFANSGVVAKHGK